MRSGRPGSTPAAPAGVALCQVMVTLTYAAGLGHTLLRRALYLPDARAADEEHRELTGIPGEVMFATKPQLAGGLLEHACELGTNAAMVAGDEVYGGRDLRQRIRWLGATSWPSGPPTS